MITCTIVGTVTMFACGLLLLLLATTKKEPVTVEAFRKAQNYCDKYGMQVEKESGFFTTTAVGVHCTLSYGDNFKIPDNILQ